MKRNIYSAAVFAATLMVSAAGAFAAGSLPKVQTEDKFVTIQLPSEEWEEENTKDGDVLFSDGDNSILIEVFKKADKLPEVTLADEKYDIVYETFFSNKNYVIVTTGYVYDEEDYKAVKKAVDSIKLKVSMAKYHLEDAEKTRKETEKKTEKKEKNDEEASRTGNQMMLANDSGDYFVVYEYSDGTWRDDNGMTYTSAYNQEGYYSGEDGSKWHIASDRGERKPDYIVYGEDGTERGLYDNGDGTASDDYGNPYQEAGQDGWIDYYGNHYYLEGFSADNERNNYGSEDYETDENGYFYTNPEWITSVDGEDRLVYWQNEFFAVDDYGNEYVYSGMDGSLTSSDGLVF